MDRREAIYRLRVMVVEADTKADIQALDLAIEALEESQSEQYKKGFEDAKRAFLIEYARESESMRKRNAQLEVMLNVQKAIEEVTAPKEMTLEEWQELDRELRGDAESATTTDCISRSDTIKAMCAECVWKHGCRGECTEVAVVKGMPSCNQTCNQTCNQKQITSKLETAETATSESEESTMGQPKSKFDCICRADAIAHIDRVTNSGLGKRKSLDFIRKYISALPPVTPTERTGAWIPVSERLPEHTGDVLVTVGINRHGVGMYDEIRVATWNTVYRVFYVHEREEVICGEIIAWQPLPEPYKGGDAE